MKSIFFGATLVLIFFAGAAKACPNLTGNWSCSESGETFPQGISQSSSGGIVTYQFTQEDGSTYQLIADGQSHALPPTNNTTGTYTVTCDSDSMLTLNETMNSAANQFTGTMNGTVTLQDPSTYVVNAQEVIMQVGQPPQNITVTETCTLQ